jgi:hypothetical protein
VAIAEEFLSYVQAGLFVRPKDLVTAAIRKINELRLVYLDKPCALVVETGIVLRNDRIVVSDLAQLGSRKDAARNYRIWVDGASISSLYLRRAEKRRHSPRRLYGDVICDNRVARFTEPAEGHNATQHNCEESAAAYEDATNSAPTPPPSAPTSRMPHCYLLPTLIPKSLGREDTTLVAVAIPVRSCPKKGKYLSIQQILTSA